MSPEQISIIAVLLAALSAVYAKRAVNEAKKSNDIGRLNSLLAFRTHYLDLMADKQKLAEIMPSNSKGLELCRESYGDLDTKLREINSQIELYHDKVVANKI